MPPQEADNCQCQNHLEKGGGPRDPFSMIVEIHQERQRHQSAQQREQCQWQKEAFGNHWGQCHQRINRQRQQNSKETDESSEPREAMETKEKNQRIVSQREKSISDKQQHTNVQQQDDESAQGGWLIGPRRNWHRRWRWCDR